MPPPAILVVDDDTLEVLARVDAQATVHVVEVLARAQLAARRAGRRVTIRNVSDELRALLELVGLAGVLAVEPRRQTELGEQLRVDEVMQPGDRPA
jgi:anti-anti-sigma regulatory factor